MSRLFVTDNRVVQFVNIMHCFQGSRFKVIYKISFLSLICIQIYFFELQKGVFELIWEIANECHVYRCQLSGVSEKEK